MQQGTAEEAWTRRGEERQDSAERGKGDPSTRAASNSAAGSQWDIFPSSCSVSGAGASRDQATKATVASVPAVLASSALSFEARARLRPWLRALSSSLLFHQTCCGGPEAPGSPRKEKAGGWGCPGDPITLRYKDLGSPPQGPCRARLASGGRGSGIKESGH